MRSDNTNQSVFLFGLAVVLIAFAVLTEGCATAGKPGEYEGVCIHPTVNGGMPSTLDESVSIDGNIITIHPPDGSPDVTVTGASCMFRKKTTAVPKSE